MPWVYSQTDGKMYHDGELFATGYAGRYGGKNNHAMQNVPDIGPLPCGIYRIGDGYDHEGLGPLTMNLKQDVANEMFGRDFFRIHGDYLGDLAKMASKGCIVLNHGYRVAINAAAQQGDRQLEVVERFVPQHKES